MKYPVRMPEKRLGKYNARCDRWVNDNFQAPFRSLVHEYCSAPIVLYTGAGVSTAPEAEDGRTAYGLPTWLELLKEIAGDRTPGEWPQDPWESADEIVSILGPRKFKKQLHKIIERPDNYTRKYGQLSSSFIKQATTLQATAAFAGCLTGRIVNPNMSQRRTHYRSSSNPRLHAVVTANYDCFLESAGSSLFRRSPLHPVTALGSSAASATRIPVFHIHGYVPHPFYQVGRRKPLVENLVITNLDYEKAWETNDVFGTTMGPQIHYLRYYTALFIGFSFTDKYVRELLIRINNDHLSQAGRTHFALLHESDLRVNGEEFYSTMGITPLVFSDFDQIPNILGQLYTAGLIADQLLTGHRETAPCYLPELLVRSHIPTGRGYHYSPESLWEIAQRCRNESVSVNLACSLGESLAPR